MSQQKLRIWWNSQFGQPAFKKDVKNIEEARKILKTLEEYDLYLGDKIISNAGGLEECYDDEWSEYYDEEGRDITEIMSDEND